MRVSVIQIRKTELWDNISVLIFACFIKKIYLCNEQFFHRLSFRLELRMRSAVMANLIHLFIANQLKTIKLPPPCPETWLFRVILLFFLAQAWKCRFADNLSYFCIYILIIQFGGDLLSNSAQICNSCRSGRNFRSCSTSGFCQKLNCQYQQSCPGAALPQA